jgi:hypothetical protein
MLPASGSLAGARVADPDGNGNRARVRASARLRTIAEQQQTTRAPAASSAAAISTSPASTTSRSVSDSKARLQASVSVASVPDIGVAAPAPRHAGGRPKKKVTLGGRPTKAASVGPSASSAAVSVVQAVPTLHVARSVSASGEPSNASGSMLSGLTVSTAAAAQPAPLFERMDLMAPFDSCTDTASGSSATMAASLQSASVMMQSVSVSPASDGVLPRPRKQVRTYTVTPVSAARPAEHAARPDLSPAHADVSYGGTSVLAAGMCRFLVCDILVVHC